MRVIIRRDSQFLNLVLILSGFLAFGGCRLEPGIHDFHLNVIPPLGVDPPKNIILIIGDGMGPEQIKAGGEWVNGGPGTMVFEASSTFPVNASMGTRNVYGMTTDSAASATAMATGSKVANRVLSKKIPGDGSALESLADMARNAGKSIGLVSTDNICGATPSAFVVNHGTRDDYEEVADLMMNFMPEVILGGGLALSKAEAESAGYTVVETDAALGLHDPNVLPVYGRFGDGYMPFVADGRGDLPNLDYMTQKALDFLGTDADGFFLVIENELIDESSHANSIAKLVEEMDAFDQTVAAVVQYAEDRAAQPGGSDDTLIVVTADHETGGLNVIDGNGAGTFPTVSWSTSGHTSRAVELYARGPDSETFALVLENVDIFRIISRYF